MQGLRVFRSLVRSVCLPSFCLSLCIPLFMSLLFICFVRSLVISLFVYFVWSQFHSLFISVYSSLVRSFFISLFRCLCIPLGFSLVGPFVRQFFPYIVRYLRQLVRYLFLYGCVQLGVSFIRTFGISFFRSGVISYLYRFRSFVLCLCMPFVRSFLSYCVTA